MRALTLLAGLLLLAVLAWQLGWRLPAPWNPWAPLDVRQPPNWLTPYKLALLFDQFHGAERLGGRRQEAGFQLGLG